MDLNDSSSERSENEEEVDDVDDNPRKEAIGEYLLYLRGCTRSTEDDVIGALSKMQEVVIAYVEKTVQEIEDTLAERLHLRLSDYVNTRKIINEINCCEGLHSIHNQNVYFKKKFKVIEPRRIELGAQFGPLGTSTVDGIERLTTKKDEFIHIPICQVLRQWMENPSYRDVTSVPATRDDGIFESYIDGKYFQNHPYRNLRPNSKSLKLYYDEIEMCDPLGSKSNSINKLGMFYWIDDDVCLEYQSQLKFINLAGIVSNPDINKYGMDTILKHLVQDIKQLEDGIRLSNGEMVYGTVTNLIGDNLAIHQVCGFRQSFSALHPCRKCSASLEQVRTMTKEIVTLFRTPEEHNLQVHNIQIANERNKEELRREYGINGGSVLNEIEGFHVTTSTPADIVHDDLEGICILTTKLLIKEICFQLRLMTLDQLNERIQNFDYGYSEQSAKPSIISESQILDTRFSLNQSAAQMAQLITMMPLIIANYVPEGWLPLENFIKMLEIIVISHADKIYVSMLGYLYCCITEYLQTFQDAYRRNLIPKQHFLLHRVTEILRLGPLARYRTIRAEAKHQYFKRIVQCMRNYKNLPLTLAKKHQLFQAYFLKSSLIRDITCGPKQWIPIDLLDFRALFPDVMRLQITPWTEVNGKKYVARKCFLAVGYSEKNLPQFAALHSIVWRDNNPIFVCRKVEVTEHNMSLMAYEVKIIEQFFTVSIANLISPDVFHAHRWNNRQYIIIKKALGRLH